MSKILEEYVNKAEANLGRDVFNVTYDVKEALLATHTYIDMYDVDDTMVSAAAFGAESSIDFAIINLTNIVERLKRLRNTVHDDFENFKNNK